MAQKDVSEAFYRAKLRIELYTGTGSPVDAVLAEWTPSDRVTFARWCRNEQKAERTVSIQEQKARRAMHPDSYTRHLQVVDFTRTAMITDFIHSTQIRDRIPYPRPIVLGSEEGITYLLCSQLVDLEPSFDLPAGATSINAITEIRSTKPKTNCPLRFVFPLGTLEYSRSTDDPRTETPFRVCINPIDRSIWLLLSLYTLNDLGDRLPILRGTDPWPYLGLHAKGRVQFDVMKLMTWEEFDGLGNPGQALRKDMFGQAKLAIQVWPTAWVPTKEAVDALIPRWVFLNQQELEQSVANRPLS